MADWRADIGGALAGAAAAVRLDEPLERHTTFRIGGPAEAWVEAGDEAALRAALGFCRERGVPVILLGRGSNVLVSDQGLAGVVLTLAGEFERVRVEGETIVAGGAAGLDTIAERAEQAGLAGAEFLAGIPGTLGGGFRTNAGAFDRSLLDVVVRVRALSRSGDVRELERAEFGTGYRRPMLDEELTVLEAELQLRAGPGEPCADVRRRRWDKQPTDPSAGSFFRNPEGDAAGRLIEACGLKGQRVGGAMVSNKHANFIVNTGAALSCEVRELAQVVKARVEEQTGIVLEEEVLTLPRERRQ